MKPSEALPALCAALQIAFAPPEQLGADSRHVAEPLVVSLTSIPSRLFQLHLVVRSLLRQTVQPERVLLWLNRGMRGSEPRSLRRLVGSRFEIRYTGEHRAHKKLIPALEAFPNHIVVTCDDDYLYPADWLERLLATHAEHPREIVAHACRAIQYRDGVLSPYSVWPWESPGQSRSTTMAVGYCGTLYPPGSLGETVFDRALYRQLAPDSDDLWFKATALLNGNAVRRSAAPEPVPTPTFFTQRISLKRSNIDRCGNERQWNSLDEHFGLRKLLGSEAQRA